MNVFLDADGVIVDFEAGAKKLGLEPAEFKHQPGAYLFLDPYPLAETALTVLYNLERQGHVKVWIATKPPSGNAYAAAEKIMFFEHHFPWLAARVIITHDKSILGGVEDVIVDDRPHKANVSNFKGRFICFDPLRQQECWEELFQFIGSSINTSY